MDDVLQQELSDEMSLKARRSVLQQMSSEVTTEDLELIQANFPHLLKCMLHEILNTKVAE